MHKALVYSRHTRENTHAYTIHDLVAFGALRSESRLCQVTQLEQRGGPKIQREMVRDREQAVHGSVFVCVHVCARADNSGLVYSERKAPHMS